MDIEADYAEVEVPYVPPCARGGQRVSPVCGAAFVPRQTAAAERKEKARRRAEFFAARDRAFERAGLPIPKIEERGGVRVERRGTCVGGAAFNPTVPISPKSYYYR